VSVKTGNGTHRQRCCVARGRIRGDRHSEPAPRPGARRRSGVGSCWTICSGRRLRWPPCSRWWEAGSLPLAAPLFGRPSCWPLLPCQHCCPFPAIPCHVTNGLHCAVIWGCLGDGLRHAATLIVPTVVFLAHQACLMGDAIVRFLVRVFLTRRNLLHCVTAAQASEDSRRGLAGSYRWMAEPPLLEWRRWARTCCSGPRRCSVA
jgi:hypothetical protein